MTHIYKYPDEYRSPATMTLRKPSATFETTDDRLTFLVTIPIHEGCTRDSETSSETGSETRDRVLDIIKQSPRATAAEIAIRLGISSRSVEKQIRKLRESGSLVRIGGRFGGHWDVVSAGKAS